MAEIAIEEETEDMVVIVTETIEAMIEASEEEEMIVDQETIIEPKVASIVKNKDIMLEIAQNVNYFIKIARAPR